MNREVFIVDGCRTPFLKAGAKPNPLAAADLGVAAAEPLLARQPFAATEIGEVIIGCVGPSAAEANIGRIIGLRVGCGDNVPGWSVQRNCASGLQAIDCGFIDIADGRHDLVLAGGTEAMSRAGMFFNEDFLNWMGDFSTAKTFKAKLLAALRFRPWFLVPVVTLLRALNDPVVNLSMGQTAEKLAYQFNISRTEMDQFSVQSHQRTAAATEQKHFAAEMVPLFDWQGKFIESDNGVRADSTVEKLATLKPVFDKPFGLVTAGNSSQISDGAAVVVLASQAAVDKYKLQPLARIIDVAWSALDPSIMGLGPAFAIAKLLHKNKLSLDAIDYFEINEAFAGQVIACIKALEDPKYCAENFGVQQPIGTIRQDRLNVDGGAVAIGHPVGATGARLTLHLAQTLRRNNAKLGIATMCIGGGQGGAILIENIAGSK
jgi:acetyl-CoA C-acetyltransferase